ncbi:MAG: hypothetical protein ACLTMW_02745 [Blautia hydrogenotrophica]
MNVKGVKVGLVGIYELKDHMERATQLKENIAKVKRRSPACDCRLPLGKRKGRIPDSNQTQLGRLAIDEGGSRGGTSPHVLQGIENTRGVISPTAWATSLRGKFYPSDMDTMIFNRRSP